VADLQSPINRLRVWTPAVHWL